MVETNIRDRSNKYHRQILNMKKLSITAIISLILVHRHKHRKTSDPFKDLDFLRCTAYQHHHHCDLSDFSLSCRPSKRYDRRIKNRILDKSPEENISYGTFKTEIKKKSNPAVVFMLVLLGWTAAG
jgi:hypothetical protein